MTYEWKIPRLLHVDGGYMPMYVVEEDENTMNQLLKQAKRDLAAFLRKYRDLKQLQLISEVIGDMLPDPEEDQK